MKIPAFLLVLLLVGCNQSAHTTLDECILYAGSHAPTERGLLIAVTACKDIYDPNAFRKFDE